MARTRKSLATPLFLIGAGVLLLLWNVTPSFSFGRIFANGWPWLLVAWGVFRIAEAAVAQIGGTPLPERLGFRHAFLAAILCVAGAATHAYYYDSVFRFHWDDDFESTHEFPIDLTAPAGDIARVNLVGMRGDIEVLPTEESEVRVTGNKRIRAIDRGAAAARDEDTPLTLQAKGDAVGLEFRRGNTQEGLRVNLRVEVPRTMRVAVSEFGGRLKVERIDGGVTVEANRASLELAQLAGDVEIELNRAEDVSIGGVAGSVQISGSVEELSIVEIDGVVQVNGNVFGEIVLADLRDRVEISSKNSELTCVRLDGMAEITGSKFDIEGFTGPAILRSRGSKRMMVREFTGPLEVTGQRADVELDARERISGDIRIHVERGDVEVEFGAGRAFQLAAETTKGEVFDDFGPGLVRANDGPGARVNYQGEGPKVSIEIGRGDVRLTRAAGEEELTGDLEEMEL